MDDEPDVYADYLDSEQDILERARRKRKHNMATKDLVEEPDDQSQFQTTYKPSRFEESWLGQSIAQFYTQNLITDVLYSVKGGKEASVYCCAAHPSTGLDLVACKVYRPRRFRNLRNDAMYREGRPILTADGNVAKRTDQRLMRAIGKKTEFGVQAQHTSWLMYEYNTLSRLHAAGAAVPVPLGASENAILMGFAGDRQGAAPALNDAILNTQEAQLLFDEAMRNDRVYVRDGYYSWRPFGV